MPDGVGAGVEAAVWALYTDTPPRPVHSVRKVATETLNSTEPSILQTHPLGMSIAQIKNMLESASLYTCARIHDLEKVLVLLLLAQGLILKLLLLSTSRCTADFRMSDLTMPSASNSSAFLMLNHCISCSVTWQNASVCKPVAHHVEQVTHDRIGVTTHRSQHLRQQLQVNAHSVLALHGRNHRRSSSPHLPSPPMTRGGPKPHMAPMTQGLGLLDVRLLDVTQPLSRSTHTQARPHRCADAPASWTTIRLCTSAVPARPLRDAAHPPTSPAARRSTSGLIRPAKRSKTPRSDATSLNHVLDVLELPSHASSQGYASPCGVPSGVLPHALCLVHKGYSPSARCVVKLLQHAFTDSTSAALWSRR
mmetsp:Transcript_79590/g.202793  ORF Transcript_79590/g.202793 Transcript_79590/m.202793 type:complete len:364 (-) Transcript_79590:110-1201(-)